MSKVKFKIGDKVKVSDDFEGSITVLGYSGNDIEDHIFTVVAVEAFAKKNPKLAKVVSSLPAKDGEIFLQINSEIFALSPVSCLDEVEKALICSCPISRLWSGQGHYSGCPEEH